MSVSFHRSLSLIYIQSDYIHLFLGAFVAFIVLLVFSRLTFVDTACITLSLSCVYTAGYFTDKYFHYD